MVINWNGPVFGNTGYARHNVSMIKGLLSLGVDIHLNPCDCTIKDVPDYLVKCLTTPFNKHGITVHLQPAPPLWGDSGYNILFTTIESMPAHPGLVHRASYFPEIWVPSKYNYNALKPFLKKNITIKIIPEGIDTSTWFIEDLKKFNTFTFICLCDWSFRKGCHELITAFTEEFSSSEAQLIFITKLHQTKNDQLSQERIIQEASECALKGGGNLNNIHFYFADLFDSDIRLLYSKSHCFVMPTKGEAWGLPILEAMGCGLPVIVPDVGGHRDFVNRGCGWFTSGYYDRMDKYHNIEVDFYHGVSFYFPKIKSIRRCLRTAFKRPSVCKSIGFSNSIYAQKHFTWDKAAAIAKKRLEEITLKGYTSLSRGLCF